MIAAKESYDHTPICPHCKMTITQLFFQKMTGFFGRRYLYFCSECKACLGVSHRKGFWMG